ncbi:MAG: DUF2262 domain-containing protein [Planctomycetota bacterium]
MPTDLTWAEDQDERFAGRFHSSMPYQSNKIELIIDNDGESFESGLKLMLETLDQLESLDRQAKNIISKDLRETYNDGWREYEELQSDGSYLTITHPPLSEPEFVSKFKLEHVEVMSASVLTLWYGQSELFAGHSIFVESLDGLNLNDAEAQMFG